MIRKKIALWLSRLAQGLDPQITGSTLQAPQKYVAGTLLKSKTVMITGAAGQIGGVMATEMAAQGAMLVLVDINIEDCEAMIAELGKHVVDLVACDVSKEKDVDELCNRLANPCSSKTDNRAANVDILIHTAGIQYERSPGESMQPAQWRDTFNTNVVGPAYLTERLLNQQRQGESIDTDINADYGLKSVLFIGSIHQTEVVGWPSYSTSKAALGMLVKELAIELAPSGIRVNSIAPGWVATDERQQPLQSRYSLLKRESVSPQSIARAAVFLCSEDCSPHTSGATLIIDSTMSLFNHRVDIEYKI